MSDETQLATVRPEYIDYVKYTAVIHFAPDTPHEVLRRLADMLETSVEFIDDASVSAMDACVHAHIGSAILASHFREEFNDICQPRLAAEATFTTEVMRLHGVINLGTVVTLQITGNPEPDTTKLRSISSVGSFSKAMPGRDRLSSEVAFELEHAYRNGRFLLGIIRDAAEALGARLTTTEYTVDDPNPKADLLQKVRELNRRHTHWDPPTVGLE